jgi:hypothetical protein
VRSPAYYSPGIATPRTPSVRRRPRRGSLERPVSGRLYRGAWLAVGLPLLIAAFSVARPTRLPPPEHPPTFSASAALRSARELSNFYPDRSPGSSGALSAARWFSEQLGHYGYPPPQIQTDGFFATIPGRKRVLLRNISAVAPGRSQQTIVVMAHRDDAGLGAGANDNASGTAALLELARAYATPPGRLPGIRPAYTILFLSTDGGSFGGLGAARFATAWPYRTRLIAVINLDALSGAHPRLEVTGDTARSPAPLLVATAVDAILAQTGDYPGRTSALGQLIDLALPFTLYEQGPFISRGIPAVTLTTMGDRPEAPAADRPEGLQEVQLGRMGAAAEALLASIDEAPQGSFPYVYLGERIVRGWAVELVLISMLLPFAIAVVDLFARCRRRRLSFAPALRAFRSRLAFWLWAGALFELFAVTGAWPQGAARPLSADSGAGVSWPRLAVLGFVLLLFASWLVARQRLVPRRPVTNEEELAGYTATLLVLGLLALVVAATNPFALLFVLPSLHAWLWLPQVPDRPAIMRAGLVVAGFLGPLLVLGSFSFRFGLGLDAPWYLAELAAIGYVPFMALVLFLAWAAGAAQMMALAAGRYTPYPAAAERPPRGPIRNTVRAIALALGAGRRVPAPPDLALEE